MIIENVKIKNFFCFVGENNFDFKKGLNIISARNGGGKSQLFNAFYWVFFNNLYTNIGESNTRKRWKSAETIPLFPDFIQHNSKDEETFETSVSISLLAPLWKDENLHKDDIKYTFSKSVKYQKVKGKIITLFTSELQVEYTDNNETHFAENYEIDDLLNKIFPQNLRKFMWYQGETMDNLYDFSNNKTLRDAIDGISYYPIYDTMDKIVNLADKNIDKQIIKKLQKDKKTTKEQNSLIDEISKIQSDIETKKRSKISYENEINTIEDGIVSIENKLQGFDHFIKFKGQLVELEGKLQITKESIDFLDHSTKEDLIKKWMLNGCESLINSSQKNLEILNQEIQTINESDNPVPITLPGPEYIERMLKDKVCYICERDVEEDSEPYNALKRRMNDFEISLNNRILSDNYTELNRYRRRLVSELPKINSGIEDVEKKKKNLLKLRNKLTKDINNLYSEIGTDEKSHLDDGAHTANKLTSQLRAFRIEVKSKTRYLQDTVTSLHSLEQNLKQLKAKSEIFTNSGDSIVKVENKAQEYISLFVDSIGELKKRAYERLISELEKESNRLYSLYLGGKEQGKISFTKDGIRILDVSTEEFLTGLNTGEEVAEKLAVANSFLSLSAKKMNRAYPIIADAPTSDLDVFNTYNLTVNLGKSFDQMIIMSKDYTQFEGAELKKLIQDANISTFYEVDNTLIDEAVENTRTNRKSVINNLKN